MQSFDYHLESVNNRLEILLLVLQYDSQETKHFTVWERMQINKERSAMQSFIDYLFREIEHSEINWFKVSEPTEDKILTIYQIIKQLNWKPEKNV